MSDQIDSNIIELNPLPEEDVSGLSSVKPAAISEVVTTSVLVSRIPRWFILLFLFLLTIFIFTTYLLFKTLYSSSGREINIAPSAAPTVLPSVTAPATPTAEFKKLDTSDEVESIQADLSETSLENFDHDLVIIDQEFAFTPD